MTSTTEGKTISSSQPGEAFIMDGALAYPPLLVTSAKFKCQREAENYSKLEDASGASLSLPLADCVLTLVASALKCVVNVRADNSLSSVSGDFQWVTISLEEIIGVSTSGPWLTVEYAPAAYTQWTRGVELASSLSSISSERVLSLTLKVSSDEACFDIMEAILAAKMRLLRHLKWLEDRLPLTDKIFVCSITAALPPGPEVVLAQCPNWDTVVAVPHEWCRYLNGDLTLGAPAGTISIYMQTHLGHSVVHVKASALEGRISGKPKHDAVMAFYAQPCPAIQTTVAELAKHNSVTYYTGSDLQAKLILRWVDLSAQERSGVGQAGILTPPEATMTTAKALDSPVASRPIPQLTPRHLLIALSFLIASLAMVVHHFVKQGKMSSGFLLLDLAAGVSLCGMLFAALPILSSGAHEAEQASQRAIGSASPDSRAGDDRSTRDATAPRWGLMLVQGDVVERDVDAEIQSEGTEVAPSVEDSARAESDSGAHGEEEDEVHTPEAQQRKAPTRPHKLRTLQSSSHMNSIDLEQAVPPDQSLRRRSTDHIMPNDIKQELMGLFPEEHWQPPNVDENLVEDMVQRFYVGCKQDKEEAKRRLLVTKKFREENGVNTILKEPQPHFFEFKRVYPHGILNKRSKGGALIEIERVGGVRKAFESMMAQNIDKAELKKHMYFLSEYYDIVADPRPLPHGKLLKIMDIEGLGMYDVFGHIFNFLYECTNVGTMHYPERLHSMLIVNAPTWINMLWKAFTPAIDPATRERIQLCGSSKSSILKLMSAEMDMDAIPEEYGGHNTCKLEDSPHEKAMADFVRKVNQRHDVSAE